MHGNPGWKTFPWLRGYAIKCNNCKIDPKDNRGSEGDPPSRGSGERKGGNHAKHVERNFRLLGTYIPSLLGALAILVIGWLIALIISSIGEKGLRKVGVNNWVNRLTGAEEQEKGIDVAKGVGTGMFYLIMLFVLVAFFQALRVPLISEPINGLLNQVFEFIPQVAGGTVLLLIAWVVAKVLKTIVQMGLETAKIDERLGSQEETEKKAAPVSKSIGDAVYWLVFLLFLPAILGALSLQGLLGPVQEMFNKLLGFLPNVITAGVLFLIGWFVARIVRQIVTNLLAAVGTDNLGEKVGISQLLGEQKLSGLIGLIVYVFILLPIAIAALNTLQLEAITSPASNMLNLILAAIPKIFAATVVLAISYAVGNLVCGLIDNLLAGIGFNNVLARLGLGKEDPDAKWTPSAIVGSLVLLAIMFFAALEASRLLGFAVVATLVSEFIVFAGHILAGLVIFAVGLALANAVSGALTAAETSHASLLGIAARVAMLVLAGAMALRQMGLANEIINMAFGMLLGAVAIAVAIAFGIGGRDIAAAELEKWVRSLKSKQE